MNAKLIQCVEGQLIATIVAAENVAEAFEARGFKLVGINNNPRQREELQGAPKFFGLCGPMWDGDILRYETPEAYKIVSA